MPKHVFTNGTIYADSGKIKYLDAVDPITGDRKFEKVLHVIPPGIVCEFPDHLVDDLFKVNNDQFSYVSEPTELQMLLWEQAGRKSITDF